MDFFQKIRTWCQCNNRQQPKYKFYLFHLSSSNKTEINSSENLATIKNNLYLRIIIVGSQHCQGNKAGIFPLNGYLLLKFKRGGTWARRICLSHLTIESIIMKKRQHSTVVQISIRVEVFRIVWVKSYKRLRLGKIERVKGYSTLSPLFYIIL